VLLAWVLENFENKTSRFLWEMASWDYQGENYHFSSMILVQKPFMDLKKYVFFL
jgi:hypothetical protein